MAQQVLNLVPTSPNLKFQMGQIAYWTHLELGYVKPVKILDWKYTVGGTSAPRLEYVCAGLLSSEKRFGLAGHVLFDKSEDAMEHLVNHLSKSVKKNSKDTQEQERVLREYIDSVKRRSA